MIDDLGIAPVHSEDSVDFGSSWIRRFKSRFISLTAATQPGVTRYLISEPGWPQSWSSAPQHGALRNFQCQAVEIAVLHDSDPVLVITRSPAIGTPLYLATDGSTLIASWRFEDAVGVLAAPKPDPEACRLYIRQGPTLTRNQVIDGVRMLWPGESARFHQGRLSFIGDFDRDVVVPSALADHARATDALTEAIASAMTPLLAVSEAPMLEISGGLDSACVGVAASTVREDLFSYGLIHDGAVGLQQRNRRGELTSLLKLRDFEYPSNAPGMFAGLDFEENQVTPFDDNHRLPCVFAVDNHYATGIDLMISGIGGDELAMQQTYRREDWELPGTACPSSLLATAQRCDMFMRRGIWVANPLTAQPVVDLCRAFPQSLRTNRTQHLLLLARAGLSDGFLFPRLFEHYGMAMQYEAARHDFDAALRSSIIADLRVMDMSPLLQSARNATNTGFTFEIIMQLFWLMKLERILRRYVC